MKIEHDPPATDCPAEVLGLIPWYPDGLDEAQRGLVEAHAAQCGACRREIEMLEGDGDPELVPPAERVYARVLARIEASPPEHATVSETDEGRGATIAHLPIVPREAPEPASSGWRRISLDPTQRGLALAAGLLTALALGTLVGGALVAPRESVSRETASREPASREPAYQTASAAPAVSAAGGPSLDVVFRDEASAADINGTLRTLDARISSGPSALGVFRVQLQPGTDLAAARKRLTEDGGVATFAEEPLHR